MKFKWNTVGHNSVKQYFEQLIAQNLFRSHAFLFVGPESIGRKTLVNDLLGALLCEHVEQRPCSKCRHCTHLAKGIHPDVFRVTKEKDLTHVTVEGIRAVVEQLQSGSLFRSKKICIIENAESLSHGAANAILKTLEEPAGETFFFFVATQEDMIPATIRSRCQIVRMYPLRMNEVYDVLVSKRVLPNIARELASFSRGRLGVILDYIGSESAWSKLKERAADQWKMLFSAGYEKSKWYGKKELLPFSSVLLYAHDVILRSLGLHDRCSFPWIQDAQKGWSVSEATLLLSASVEAMNLERQNVNSKMIIDSIHARVRNMV